MYGRVVAKVLYWLLVVAVSLVLVVVLVLVFESLDDSEVEEDARGVPALTRSA